MIGKMKSKVTGHHQSTIRTTLISECRVTPRTILPLLLHFYGFLKTTNLHRNQPPPHDASAFDTPWHDLFDCSSRVEVSLKWSLVMFWRFLTNLTSLLGEGKNTQMTHQCHLHVVLSNQAGGGRDPWLVKHTRRAWECLLHWWTSYSSHCDKSRDGEVPLWSVSKLEN